MNARKAVFIVLSVGAVITTAALSLFLYQRGGDARDDARCIQNLTKIGTALQQYASESKGEKYPDLSRIPGRLSFDADQMVPNYLDDASYLHSPLSPLADSPRKKATDSSQSVSNDTDYWYLGYLLANERSGLEWVEQYQNHFVKGESVPEAVGIWQEYEPVMAERQRMLDLDYERNPSRFPRGRLGASPNLNEMRTYVPLRIGAGRYITTAINDPVAPSRAEQSIPVMVERPELHGDGGHVLYMDGHVEFVPYPGKFPMTPKFIEGLRSLDELEKPRT